MISSVRSVNDTKHIALHNYDNSFCYHISNLQRLHCSPTLNRLCRSEEVMRKMGSDDEVMKRGDIREVLMLPIKIYAELDDGGTDDGGGTNGAHDPSHDTSTSINEGVIYSRIKEYFNKFVPNFVAPAGRHGYDPTILLIYFLLPVVYSYFPEKFKDIIEEIHVDKINFNNIDYVCENVIMEDKNSFVQSVEDRKTILGLYKSMIENLPKKYNRHSFVASVIEVFPNKDRTGGHAITLIKGWSTENVNGEAELFIIDDQNSISKLADYYNSRKERLYELTIRDVDEITIANVNAIFHAKCDIDPSCKFSKRVSRFVLNFEHNFLTVKDEMLKPELRNGNSMEVEDVYVKDERNGGSGKTMFVVGLVIGLFIGILISIIAKSILTQTQNSINNNTQAHINTNTHA